MIWATSLRLSALPPVPKAWRMARADWGEMRPSGRMDSASVGRGLGDGVETWYSSSGSTLIET